MKLTLEHLSPYLPYKLNFVDIADNEVYELNALYDNGDAFNWDSGEVDLELIKPILRPLSELVQEIEHNDKVFIPFLEFYRNKRFTSTQMRYLVDEIKYLAEINRFPEDTELYYWVMQKLFEWHFDVFNLIREDLAININNSK